MQPLTQKDLQSKISEETDTVLLQWLTTGYEDFSGQFDKNTGDPIMVRRPLTPAMMRCVLTRLGQLGITAIPAVGTPAGNLAAAAAARGIGSGPIKFNGKPVAAPKSLPPLSMDADAASA